MRELAFLNKGLSITLKDERKEPAKEQVFLYKGGIVSFVEHLNEAKTPLHKPIYVRVEKPEMLLEVALQYNDSYAENLFSFAGEATSRLRQRRTPTPTSCSKKTPSRCPVTTSGKDSPPW